MPKTGSSSLQQFLTDNSLEFAKQGIYYPKSPSNTVAQHCFGAIHLNKDSDRYKRNGRKEEKAALFLLEDIKRSKYQNILLSSEYFWKAHPAVLLDYFRDFEIIVIGYFRLAHKFAASIYQEATKNPRLYQIESLEKYLQHYPYDFMEEHCRRLEQWLACSDTIDLRLKLFERDNLVGGNVIHDVLAELSVDSSARFLGLNSGKRSNASLSAEMVEALRYLNGCPMSANRRRKLYRFAQDNDAGEVKFCLTSKQEREVISYFSGWCATVLPKHFPEYVKYNVGNSLLSESKAFSQKECVDFADKLVKSFDRSKSYACFSRLYALLKR